MGTGESPCWTTGLTFRARSSWLQRSMRAMSKSRLMAREVISGLCSV